jgi:hypothetical protein
LNGFPPKIILIDLRSAARFTPHTEAYFRFWVIAESESGALPSYRHNEKPVKAKMLYNSITFTVKSQAFETPFSRPYYA